MSTNTRLAASRKWPSLLFWPPPRDEDYVTLAFAAGLALLIPWSWSIAQGIHVAFNRSGFLLVSAPLILGTLLGLRLWSLRAVDNQRLWPGHLRSIHPDLALGSILILGAGLIAAALDPAVHPMEGVSISLISACLACMISRIPPLLVFSLFIPAYLAPPHAFLRTETWALTAAVVVGVLFVAMIVPARNRSSRWSRNKQRFANPGGEHAKSESTSSAQVQAAPSPRPDLEIHLYTLNRPWQQRIGGIAHQVAWIELTGGSRRWYWNLFVGFMIPMAAWLIVFSILTFDPPSAPNASTYWLPRLLDAVLAGGAFDLGSSASSFTTAALLSLSTWLALHHLHRPPHSAATGHSSGRFGRAVELFDRYHWPLPFLLLAAPVLILTVLWLKGGPESIDPNDGRQLASLLSFFFPFLGLAVVARRSQQAPLAASLIYPVNRSQRIRGTFTAALRWQTMGALATFATFFAVGRVGLTILTHQGMDTSRWQLWIPAGTPTSLVLLSLPCLAALHFFSVDPGTSWLSLLNDTSSANQVYLLMSQFGLFVYGFLYAISLGDIENHQLATPLAIVCLIATMGASQFLLWLQLKHRYGSSAWASTPLP